MKNFSIKLLKNVSLTALLMVSAMFTACSSSDEILNEQSANPTESQVYTMTVQVSKSTGDDTTPRSLLRRLRSESEVERRRKSRGVAI